MLEPLHVQTDLCLSLRIQLQPLHLLLLLQPFNPGIMRFHVLGPPFELDDVRVPFVNALGLQSALKELIITRWIHPQNFVEFTSTNLFGGHVRQLILVHNVL